MEQKKLKHILLIDDDEPTTFMYTMVLEQSGYSENILVAQGGEEALDILQKTSGDSPELIFVDINMPRMDGWEFLEQYKQISNAKTKKPVIIMLSTSLNPDDETKANEIPEVAAFMHKPLTPGMLQQIVMKYFYREKKSNN